MKGKAAMVDSSCEETSPRKGRVWLCLWRRASARKGNAGSVDSRKGKDRKVRVARASRPAFLPYGRRLALPALPVMVLMYSIYANHDVDRALYHTGRTAANSMKSPSRIC